MTEHKSHEAFGKVGGAQITTEPWGYIYLRDMSEGFRALKAEVIEYTEAAPTSIFQELAALRWVVPEEERRAVRMLSSRY